MMTKGPAFFTLSVLLIAVCHIFVYADEEKESLSLKWKIPIGGRISGLPVETPAGGVAVQSENRYIYIIGPTGQVTQRINTYQRFSGPLAVSPDGSLYTGVGAATIMALNGSGEIRWKRRFESPLGKNILTGPGGELYLVLQNGTLYSITPNGTTRWRSSTAAEPVLSAGLDTQGRIIIPSADNFIYAVLPWGTEVWKFKTAGRPSAYAFYKNDIICGSSSNTIVRVSETGTMLWQLELDGIPLDIVHSGDTIFAAAGSGDLYSISPDGSVNWKRSHSTGISDLYLGGGDSVLAVDNLGEIMVFNYEGSYFGSIRGGSSFLSGGLSAENTLYLGGEDWILYGYEAAAPKAGLWSQRGGSAQRRWSLLKGMNPDFWLSYFRDDPDFQTALAFMNYGLNNREMDALSRALDLIEDSVRSRDPGIPRPYLVYFLQRIATQHITEISRTKPEKDYPSIRLRALALLKTLESPYAGEVYRTIIEHEWNEAVLVAVFENFKEMPSDPSGEIVRSICMRVRGETAYSEAFFATASKALMAAVRFRGVSPGQEVIDTALHIFRFSRDPVTKRNALDIVRY